MAKKQQPAPAKPKGDKEKQFDVLVTVIHDSREGTTQAVQKPLRYSYATEAEAVAVAEKLHELLEAK